MSMTQCPQCGGSLVRHRTRDGYIEHECRDCPYFTDEDI